MATNSGQQAPLDGQVPHVDNEPQVREFFVADVGYAYPNDDRLAELAEMGVSPHMYEQSIEVARQALLLHDQARTTILNRIVDNLPTLRNRLGAMAAGPFESLYWFFAIYAMTRRWSQLHPQVTHAATRLTFAHLDTLQLEDTSPAYWRVYIRQWLDCMIHSHALGRCWQHIPELQHCMENIAWLVTGDDPDQPDDLYDPQELLAEAAALDALARTALFTTTHLLNICLNQNVGAASLRIAHPLFETFRSRHLGGVGTGFTAAPSATTVDVRLPLPAFRSFLTVYLPYVQERDAAAREEGPHIQLLVSAWVPVMLGLTAEELSAAAPEACNICRGWANDGTGELVQLRCSDAGCKATFHGGNDSCVVMCFNTVQQNAPICPLCKQPVERRFV